MKKFTYNSILVTVVVSLFIIVKATAQTVQVWVTDASGSKKLEQQASVEFQSSVGSGSNNIVINAGITYQSIDGFGAAMTGSSAFLINRLNNQQKEALMNDLFTASGIRMGMMRHTIGASDFNLQSYTYNDLPHGETDPTLSKFSIDYDKADIIPVIKLALQKNPGLKIMGSAWSAPAWMKENKSLNGGWLDIQWYKAYANYLVKYIQAYSNEGIPVWAITLQNEPLHETSSYPTMRMDAGNQISFLKNDIGPAFASSGLNTKLIVYDHNWDRPDYPIEVLNHPEARVYAAGSAFHAYAGSVSAQSNVHNAHPDKDIWFTEISGGRWATHFGNNIKWYMNNILIGATRNWAKGALFWNIALDENDGPTNGGCSNCRGVVTIHSNGSIIKNEEYYAIGHVSKFVDQGAFRIESNTTSAINNVAFKNPDGSIVVLAMNNSNKPSESFTISAGGKSFSYTLQKGSAVTFKWSPSQSNQAPTVSLTSPSNNAAFSAGTNITLTADASDPDGSVTKVEFFNGSNLLATVINPPYTYTWPSVAAGSYTLTAKATDNAGLSSTSTPVNISVTSGSSSEMLVQSIVTGTVNAGQGNKSGSATIRIVNTSGQPVSAATVQGTFSGTFTESAQGITSADGTVVLNTAGRTKGTVLVVFCVENVTHSSLTYNASLNVVTCSDDASASRLGGENVPNKQMEIEETNNNPEKQRLLSGSTDFLIYPNPMEGNAISIDNLNAGDLPIKLKIINSNGQQILQEEIKSVRNIVVLPAHMSKGVYLLILSNDHLNKIRKLVVK